ncbi:hypothetical protein CcaCcLH18_12791 [Colletotrichum camelliae]|nr:hypothetical protein CcaCcLH18_12791 [Colletotrichum camelliae]
MEADYYGRCDEHHRCYKFVTRVPGSGHAFVICDNRPEVHARFEARAAAMDRHNMRTLNEFLHPNPEPRAAPDPGPELLAPRHPATKDEETGVPPSEGSVQSERAQMETSSQSAPTSPVQSRPSQPPPDQSLTKSVPVASLLCDGNVEPPGK